VDVGGIPTPLKNMSEFVSWDDLPFPTVSGKSNQIPWFQSPPTRYMVIPMIKHRLTIDYITLD